MERWYHPPVRADEEQGCGGAEPPRLGGPAADAT